MLERLGAPNRAAGSGGRRHRAGDRRRTSARSPPAWSFGQLGAAPRPVQRSRGSSAGTSGWSGTSPPDEPGPAPGSSCGVDGSVPGDLVNTQRRTAIRPRRAGTGEGPLPPGGRPHQRRPRDPAHRGLGGSRPHAGPTRRRSRPGSPDATHRVVPQDRRGSDPRSCTRCRSIASRCAADEFARPLPSMGHGLRRDRRRPHLVRGARRPGRTTAGRPARRRRHLPRQLRRRPSLADRGPPGDRRRARGPRPHARHRPRHVDRAVRRRRRRADRPGRRRRTRRRVGLQPRRAHRHCSRRAPPGQGPPPRARRLEHPPRRLPPRDHGARAG